MRAGKAMACLLALAGVAAQDVPRAVPGQDEDVVVTGEVTRVEPGLWTFERRPTRVVRTEMLPRSRRALSSYGGGEAQICVADDALPDAVRQLLGAGRDVPPQPGCSRMKIEVRQGRVAGRRSCTRDRAVRKEEYTGRLTPTSIDVWTGSRLEADVLVVEETSRLLGRRIGACAGQALPAIAAPLASPSPRPVPAGAGAAAPVETPQQPTLVRSEDDHDYRIMKRPPPPPVAGEAEDVVVVARKLRLMRLHYGSDGKFLRFCHADISSGDPRIDRIGCAMLRLCVRDGFDDRPSALACLNRRIDFVDSAARRVEAAAAPPPAR